MKKFKMTVLLLLSSAMLVSCYKERKDVPHIVPPDTTNVVEVPYKERARQVYDNIIRLYSLTGSNYLRESFPAQPGDPAAAFFWPHTSMLGGAMLLRSLGYSDPSFQRILDGMEGYWDEARLPAGYQAIPLAHGGSDRFYDDNAIAGLDLLRAYEQTGEQQYLDRARECLAFCMSGESEHQGGGLFWNEQYRTNNTAHHWSIKAANVTALSANLALKLYQETPTQYYLDAAIRWYDWTNSKLQDPSDKIYWNDIAMSDGSINTMKWTYNTGAMITNACLLYTITGNGSYLAEAKSLAQASYNYFTRPVRDLGQFFPHHDPWFTMILVRGYMDLYELDNNPEYINTIMKNVDHAWKHARNSEGQFYEDWSGERPGRYHSILTQECMVEIYALLSKFNNE